MTEENPTDAGDNRRTRDCLCFSAPSLLVGLDGPGGIGYVHSTIGLDLKHFE